MRNADDAETRRLLRCRRQSCLFRDRVCGRTEHRVGVVVCRQHRLPRRRGRQSPDSRGVALERQGAGATWRRAGRDPADPRSGDRLDGVGKIDAAGRAGALADDGDRSRCLGDQPMLCRGAGEIPGSCRQPVARGILVGP